MAKEPKSGPISVRLSKDVLEFVDAYADALRMSRSEAVEALVITARDQERVTLPDEAVYTVPPISTGPRLRAEPTEGYQVQVGPARKAPGSMLKQKGKRK